MVSARAKLKIEHRIMSDAAGRDVWESLIEKQRETHGLRPVKPCQIRKKDGKVCVGPLETLQQW